MSNFRSSKGGDVGSVVSAPPSRLAITNSHAFELKILRGDKCSFFDGKTRADRKKQEAMEEPSQVIGRLLSGYWLGSRLLSLNDEAHDCYLPKVDKRKAEGKDVRMHNDLLQVGLLNKDKKAASLVTIGEPDICLYKRVNEAKVEIAGLDICDPVKDEVKSRDVYDIADWMLADGYDGSNSRARQVFFCGGERDEFDEWRKDLRDLAEAATEKKVEQTLKLLLDDAAFERIYGRTNDPIAIM
jgi:hypothetical protein